jgi:hypothetical protein
MVDEMDARRSTWTPGVDDAIGTSWTGELSTIGMLMQLMVLHSVFA